MKKKLLFLDERKDRKKGDLVFFIGGLSIDETDIKPLSQAIKDFKTSIHPDRTFDWDMKGAKLLYLDNISSEEHSTYLRNFWLSFAEFTIDLNLKFNYHFSYINLDKFEDNDMRNTYEAAFFYTVAPFYNLVCQENNLTNYEMEKISHHSTIFFDHLNADTKEIKILNNIFQTELSNSFNNILNIERNLKIIETGNVSDEANIIQFVDVINYALSRLILKPLDAKNKLIGGLNIEEYIDLIANREIEKITKIFQESEDGGKTYMEPFLKMGEFYNKLAREHFLTFEHIAGKRYSSGARIADGIDLFFASIFHPIIMEYFSLQNSNALNKFHD